LSIKNVLNIKYNFMADTNRNQRDTSRTSNQEWNQGRDWEDRNESGSQENRDYGYSGSNSRFERENDEGYSSRWNRDSNYGRDFATGRHDRDFNSGRYGQDRNYGYGGREYGSAYGGGVNQGNSSYYDRDGTYGTGGSSYGNSRNLYDRDYEGYNRGAGRGSSIGASNYGDRGREGSMYGGNGGSTYGSHYNYRDYGRGTQGRNYGRGYSENDPTERSWWDRTKDEVSSWFGDDDAERRRQRDSYRGKGPKNYSRSDDRIKEDVNDRLSDDPWIDASEIDVTVNSGEVTLTGTVSERSEKRRAEDIAEAISGVKNVENRLRVSKREESTIGTGSSIGTGGPFGSGSYPSQTGVTGTTGATAGNKSKTI
jgi:osmotically-inducible protein OsmY